MSNQPLDQSKDSSYNYFHQNTQSSEIKYIKKQLSKECNGNSSTNRKTDSKTGSYFEYVPSARSNQRQSFVNNDNYEKPSLPYYVVPVLYVPQKVLSSEEIRQASSFQQKQPGSFLHRNYQQAREGYMTPTEIDNIKCIPCDIMKKASERTNRSESEELLNEVNLDEAYAGYVNASYTDSSTSNVEDEDRNYLPNCAEKKHYPSQLGCDNKKNTTHIKGNIQTYNKFLQQQKRFGNIKGAEENPAPNTNVFLRWNPDCNYYEIVEETLIMNQEILKDATNQIQMMKQKHEQQLTNTCYPLNIGRHYISDSNALKANNVGNVSCHFPLDNSCRAAQLEKTAEEENAIDETLYKTCDEGCTPMEDPEKLSTHSQNYSIHSQNQSGRSQNHSNHIKTHSNHIKTHSNHSQYHSNHDSNHSNRSQHSHHSQNHRSYSPTRSHYNQDPYYRYQDHSDHHKDHSHAHHPGVDPTLRCKKASKLFNKVASMIGTTMSCQPGTQHRRHPQHVLSVGTVKHALKELPALTVDAGRYPKESQTTFDDNFIYSTHNSYLRYAKSTQTLDPKATRATTGTQTDKTMRGFATVPPSSITKSQEETGIVIKRKNRETSPSKIKRSPSPTKFPSEAKKLSVVKPAVSQKSTFIRSPSPTRIPKNKKKKN